ncbi:MAG: GGDEF domain-containing protein [Anaerolineales bacterium]|nr:GGDEF domain-containing protein [Anaerolineales bacterium]
MILWVLNTYNKHLEYLAAHDELTGLYNRRSFQQLMEREINISKRYKQPLSLLMIDIDDFKKVNDTYGHIIGDEILKLITQNIFNSFRGIDIVARWGGEEICVLLVNTDKTGAYAAALRVQEEIDKIDFQQEKSPIHITVSIGVASIDLDNPNGQNLILQADKAMYQSKVAGKNLVSSL